MQGSKSFKIIIFYIGNVSCQLVVPCNNKTSLITTSNVMTLTFWTMPLLNMKFSLGSVLFEVWPCDNKNSTVANTLSKRRGGLIGNPWYQAFDILIWLLGEQHGYNIPEVTSVPHLSRWLSEDGVAMLDECRDDKLLPEQARRLICDGYLCFYQSLDVMMYQWHWTAWQNFPSAIESTKEDRCLWVLFIQMPFFLNLKKTLDWF